MPLRRFTVNPVDSCRSHHRPDWVLCRVAVFGLCLLVGSGGCGLSTRGSSAGGGAGGDVDAGGGPCTEGSHRCYGDIFQGCNAGGWANEDTCMAACDAMLGCVPCAPGMKFCDGDTVRACTAEGQPGASITTCQSGSCSSGACTDPCGKAASEFSYIGCDYWPTVTVNNVLTAEAHFAVAVANPNSAPVDVQVTRNGGMAINVNVLPNSLQTIVLPWVTELKDATTSELVAGGAYKLSASLPVTVYQFNPVEYEVNPCNGGSCFTYTNDASLLLPSSTLTTHYIVIARPTFEVQDIEGGLLGNMTSYVAQSPGFFAVTAVDPGVTTVTVKFTAPTMAAGSGRFAAFAKGQTGTFKLNQSDVLQVFSQVPSQCTPNFTEKVDDTGFSSTSYGYCDLPDTDLTGSEISTDHKVSVFGGHNCSFVPYNRWACDHLEEQMLPLEGWGKRYLAQHAQRHPDTIPDLWRVVSGANHNTIAFLPASAHAPVTLDRGQWLEFPSAVDFEVVGTAALAVAQFMVGQDYAGYQKGGNNTGDPDMTLSVPVEQYRTSYIFLAPPSYQENYVNVTAPTGKVVTLDGKPVDATQFKPIGGGEFSGARIAIAAGTHNVSCAQPLGIQVYGLAPYTSYSYPGGLDVKQMNIQ